MPHGNAGKRPRGHKTRGIHKRVRVAGGASPVRESQKKAQSQTTYRRCPKCLVAIKVRRFVSQKVFHEHVKNCQEVPDAER